MPERASTSPRPFKIDRSSPQLSVWDNGMCIASTSLSFFPSLETYAQIKSSWVEPWPIGTYRLYAWMPATKGGITGNYSLTVDRQLIASDAGTETVSVTAPANLPVQWVEIGSWTTDKYYERPRKIGLTLEIKVGLFASRRFLLP